MRSPFLLGLAFVFGGLTGLLVVVSIAANSPVTVVVALPLGATALIVWYHASGRMVDRVHPSAASGVDGDAFGRARGFGSDGRAGFDAAADGGWVGDVDPGWFVDGTGRRWYVDGAGQRWQVDGAGQRWHADGARYRVGPEGRRRRSVGSRRVGGAGRRRRRRVDHGPPGGTPDAPSMRSACDVLDVQPDADEATIRAAYRAKVKRVHPDTEEGSVEAFKRVTAAYERLTE